MTGFIHQKSVFQAYRYGVLLAMSVMLLISIVPIIITANYVNHASSANFLLAPDEWINRLPLAVITAEGELEAKHFFEEFGGTQHNIVFAQISVVVSTLLQNWNTTTENYITLAIALGVLLVIVRIAYLYFERRLLLTLATLMVGAWLVFNTQSDIIWVSMVMSIRLHVVFFLLVGLLVLMSPNLTMGRILLLSVIGFFATFSGSVGMMVWPAYFFVLLFHPSRSWRYLALLLVLGTLFVLLYVYSISDTVLAARQL
ncbi:MAG: hypothetical protein MUF38_07485, partial [Anaerolineae bacterium]|nr:hypothetical protein [Anaerolineae bacterium]